MLGGLIAGVVGVAMVTAVFTLPTFLAAKFFDAGHATIRRSAMAVAAGTGSGFVVASLLGGGLIALLIFLITASAVVMVVLDLSLAKAIGTVLFAGALMFSIVSTLPEFTAKFLPVRITQAQDR